MNKISRFISPKDEEILLLQGYKIDYVKSDFGNVIIIKNIKLNTAYSPKKTHLAIKVIYGYNGRAIFDMFWTYPYVYFKVGNTGVFPQNSHPSDLIIDGITWQRWSRHYTDQSNGPITVVQHINWAVQQIEEEAKKWKRFNSMK